MSYFIRKSNTFTVTDSADIHDKLPVGNYAVRLSDSGFYLEKIDDFAVPARLYGTIVPDAERIMRTFHSRRESTGVLLVGEKGSGKTLLAKQMSRLCAQAGFPTIVVNQPFTGDGFNTLIQAINTEALILFDEFEKVYRNVEDNNAQDSILTLLDGVYPTKKLFVLTCNSKWLINDHLWNRPGRIFYSIDFQGLDESFVHEYCEINLQNQDRIDQVKLVASMFSKLNFDMLQSLVEETNRYDEDPRLLLRMLNIKPEFDDGATYDVTITIEGFTLPKSIVSTKSWDGNPTRMGGRLMVVVSIPEPCYNRHDGSINIKGLKKFTKEHSYIVTEDDDFFEADSSVVVEDGKYNGSFRTIGLAFNEGDIVRFARDGSVTFRNDKDQELTLTRRPQRSTVNPWIYQEID